MNKIKTTNNKYRFKTTKWALNIFPPLFFNRIKITYSSQDFKHLKVKIKYSWINKNIQNSIFGGTILSAIDPYHAVMYWHIFKDMGCPMEVWVKKIEARYTKPAKSDLSLEFKLTDKEIQVAITAMQKENRFEAWHNVDVFDETGEKCAESRILVFIRNSNNLKISHL